MSDVDTDSEITDIWEDQWVKLAWIEFQAFKDRYSTKELLDGEDAFGEYFQCKIKMQHPAQGLQSKTMANFDLARNLLLLYCKKIKLVPE